MSKVITKTKPYLNIAKKDDLGEYIESLKKINIPIIEDEIYINSLKNRIDYLSQEIYYSNKALLILKNHRKLFVVLKYLYRIAFNVNSIILKIYNYKVYLNPANIFWRIKTKIPPNNRHKIKFINSKLKTKKTPLVSIIIPVYGNVVMTLNCIKSIVESNPKTEYEIIVINDASKDQTDYILKKIKKIIYIKNETNKGYILSVNKASDYSIGKYLLFLNNDTVVLNNWLDALVERIKLSPDYGIIGSKLIYPNGTLQEAGAILYKDGKAHNYGNTDNPYSFEYEYSREVDYCSGASMLIKKELFFNVGKLSEYLVPAYYDDVDLALKIKQNGYKTIYEPKSMLYHNEGSTHGKDLSSGIKKYQVINHNKFVKQWKDQLKKQYTSNNVLKSRDIFSRRTVLIIDHYIPEPDKDSGSNRMFNFIKVLINMGYKVTFWPDNLNRSSYAQSLQDIGVEVVFGHRNFKDFATARKNFYNLVILSRPSIAPKYLYLVKYYFYNAKTVYDTVDLAFLRTQREALLKRNNFMQIEAENWKNIEIYLMKNTDVTLVVSEKEKKIIEKLDSSINIGVVSNIHSVKKIKFNITNKEGLVFVGGFSHSPNVDAMIWFCKNIMPKINKINPKIKLKILGSNPTKEIIQLKSKNIEILGYVTEKELERIFNKSKIFIAPLRYGAGVKGKIGQAIEYGLPVIGTPIAIEGMYLKDNESCLQAETEKEFIDKILYLYNNDKLMSFLTKNASKVLDDNFSFDAATKSLKELLNR